MCEAEEIGQREKRSLIGLIISNQSITKEAFKSTIQSVWKLIGKIIIKKVGMNLYIFEFQETLDLMRVQNGRSWSLDRNLLCLTPFNGKLGPNQIEFLKEPFWV